MAHVRKVYCPKCLCKEDNIASKYVEMQMCYNEFNGINMPEELITKGKIHWYRCTECGYQEEVFHGKN